MQLNYDVKLKDVVDPNNNFGNIESAYSSNNLFFMKDGKPYTFVSGEIHFSRYDESQWRREVLKMKASGVNVIATYLFWNMHEIEPNKFDFSGNRNIRKFVEICSECDMPVLIRVGPWCHGEVVLGGLPKWVNRGVKRCNNQKYLGYVQNLYTAYYNQLSDLLDGKKIIGMQLENEFGGSMSHMTKLKEMAIEIGFKVPFFTMTAWPMNIASSEFLPTFGGYPEAPWTFHKKPLPLAGRFNIVNTRDQSEIGADLIKNAHKIDALKFDNMPFAGCEVGAGVHPTQHRRPWIKDVDGYAVPFAKFASGMNWMGYYMYHGCRNNNDKLWQESRRTGYPNNYQIIDYDFQAPISRYGKVRPHGNRLRLLHYFITQFDKNITTKQSVFCTNQPNSNADLSVPRSSIRINENGEGYVFISTYERLTKFEKFENVACKINTQSGCIELPAINIAPDSLIVYPFNITFDGKKFDYIHAQPITKIDVNDDEVHCYLMKINGVKTTACVDGKVVDISDGYEFDGMSKKVKFFVLDESKAMQFYAIDNKVIFTSGNAYQDKDKIVIEHTVEDSINISGENVEIENSKVKCDVELKQINKIKLPLDSYLYAHGKRKFYSLKVSKEMIENSNDYELSFKLEGSSLQVFCGDQIIDDHFNTNGNYVINIKEYKKYFLSGKAIVIKVASTGGIGVGKVYNEIDIKAKVSSLTFAKCLEIFTKNIAD